MVKQLVDSQLTVPQLWWCVRYFQRFRFWSLLLSTGSAGDFSAVRQIHTTGAVTVDGAAATTGSVAFTTLSASGAVTLSMGSGTGGIVNYKHTDRERLYA